jgi:predicted transcriptional regulator
MKNKHFHIYFGSIDTLAEQAKLALTNGIKQESAAIFSNLDSFMRFMFPYKFMILMMIKTKKPGSLYELAQLSGRSQSGVLADCKELEAMGFICLEKTGPRKAMLPTLKFPYDSIIVHTEIGDSIHILPTAA